MKFTKETLNVLKNFAGINQGIEFRAGNVIKTMHPHKVVMAEAQIQENMPLDFAVYDLNQFLNAGNLFDDPEFNFDSESVEISGGNRVVNYRASDRSMITLPPEKEVTFPGEEVSFSVSEEDFDAVLKASSILGVNDIAVVGDGEKVYLKALDQKSSSSNNFVIDTGATTDKVFTALFKVENLKLMSGSYDIKIAQRAGLFQNKNIPLKYWVTVEQGSTFQ